MSILLCRITYSKIILIALDKKQKAEEYVSQSWCWLISRKLWFEEEICAWIFTFLSKILWNKAPNDGPYEEIIIVLLHRCHRNNNSANINFSLSLPFFVSLSLVKRQIWQNTYCYTIIKSTDESSSKALSFNNVAQVNSAT